MEKIDQIKIFLKLIGYDSALPKAERGCSQGLAVKHMREHGLTLVDVNIYLQRRADSKR